ncbi:MAG: hypothetical protein HFJ52_00185 [Clostridia bacterium]|jgi:hypothetical protein|nr:hypothetical protein [Clostridia bacterium]
MISTVDNDLKDVRMATLRMSNDIYRSTIYKASQMANSGAKTLHQAIDMATRDFLSRGFNCIEYKNGRRVNIADYADMAVRTATKRANLMGEGELRKKLGNPLVYVSKHSTSCDKCAKWQGRVYIDDVWSGGKAEDGKYPLLSTAIAGGLYHNRCMHGQSTYFEDMNEEPEEIQENEHNKNDEYIQALRRRRKEYERLAIGSLLPENAQEYSNKVEDLQKQIEDATISEEEQYAINSYISSESYKINDKLRNGIQLDDMENKIVKDLDSALRKMKNYEGNTIRVLDIKDNKKLQKFIKSNEVGKEILFKEYLSFSNKTNYNENANVLIYVKSRKGKDLRRFNPEESEILYPRNSKFLVENVVEKDGVIHILWSDLNE